MRCGLWSCCVMRNIGLLTWPTNMVVETNQYWHILKMSQFWVWRSRVVSLRHVTHLTAHVTHHSAVWWVTWWVTCASGLHAWYRTIVMWNIQLHCVHVKHWTALWWCETLNCTCDPRIDKHMSRRWVTWFPRPYMHTKETWSMHARSHQRPPSLRNGTQSKVWTVRISSKKKNNVFKNQQSRGEREHTCVPREVTTDQILDRRQRVKVSSKGVWGLDFAGAGGAGSVCSEVVENIVRGGCCAEGGRKVTCWMVSPVAIVNKNQ